MRRSPAAWRIRMRHILRLGRSKLRSIPAALKAAWMQSVTVKAFRFRMSEAMQSRATGRAINVRAKY